MAYDPVKAHEYYEKYRKKGLKKGRKKGRKKTTSSKAKTQTLIGFSSSGLNDNGKMQWAIKKKDLQDEMNAELAKAKTPEERQAIRSDYQNRALQTLQEMKSDVSMQRAKKSSTGKSSTSKSAKNTESRKSSKKNKKVVSSNIGDYGTSTDDSRKSRSNGGKGIKITSRTNRKYNRTSTTGNIVREEMEKMKEEIQSQIDQIRSMLDVLTELQKDTIRNKIQDEIDILRQRITKA